MAIDQREFIIIMRNIPSIEAIQNLKLNNLTAYRIDALLRCINAAFFLSNDFRRDTELYVCLGDNTLIKFSGKSLRGLNPDERQLAGVLKKATLKRKYPGIVFANGGLEELQIDPLDTVLLSQSKIKINYENLRKTSRFILGGYQGFIKKDMDYLTRIGIPALSMGDKLYLTSHCIVFINILMDYNVFQGFNVIGT
ncbi:MAG: hypothetical protein ACFFC7_08830 [Candidatus Hermodarchaeota archaeon]